jgi:hypothetical protein
MIILDILEKVRGAFVEAERPNREDIIHCDFDRSHGGVLHGPCAECLEVIEFFDTRPNSGLSPEAVSDVAFGLASFTPSAFRYWLPAFVEVALINSDEGWRARESLEFRFQSLESEAWQAARFAILGREELSAMRCYFEHLVSDPRENQETMRSCISKIDYWLLKVQT